MDYEKLHRDTINNLQQMVNSGKITAEIAHGICADFVPESDDERIRKEIITYLSTVEDKELIPYEPWIAWLEKQGEHINFLSKIQVGDKVTRNKDGVLVNLFQLNRVAKPAEKQCKKLAEKYNITGIKSKHAEGKLGEMIKEMKSTHKVESKFHKGDWVLNNVCFPIQIASTEGDMYVFTDGEAISSSFVDENYHLWSIQDAEDGDVLVNGNEIVIFKENNFNQKDLSGCMFVHCSLLNNKGYWYTIGGINPSNYAPATKEQRDLLFQKMKEAGYEWDAEKKVLKKVEQKPVWSEEDEQYLLVCKNALAKYQKTDKWDASIISQWLEFLKDRVCPKQEWSEEDESYLNTTIAYLKDAKEFKKTAENCINWLKSLKDRYTWKPSDEQMKQLGWIAEQNKDNIIGKELMTLYNDLKQL